MPKQTSPEVVNALDGIEELCNFLDVKFMFPLNSRTGPIDQALEANEQQIRRQKYKQKTESQNNPYENDLMKPLLDGGTLPSCSTGIESTLEKGACNDEHISNYEKPDTGFMLQSTRLLGNTKEIELMPIVSDEKIVYPSSDKSMSNKGLPVVDPTSFD